jgi:DNA-directed RNA polymerase specialized sigma24 family protein
MKHRTYFVLYYMDELSQEEIAVRQETTANAVKCALRSIRQSLRDQFGEELAALGLHNS